MESCSRKLIEVADLFREVVEKCPELDGRDFAIMNVELPPTMTPFGYELVMRIERGELEKATVMKLYEIAVRKTKNNAKTDCNVYFQRTLTQVNKLLNKVYMSSKLIM